MQITLGCDPEFYVVHKDTKKPVSAHDLVPGTKDKPSPLPNGGAVQRDGVAVEFNIEPASTGKEFADNILSALNDIRKIIPDKYEFKFLPVVDFDKKYFESIPDDVKVLGCDPDMNAYTGTFNESPSASIQDRPTRAFGGHIHIGWGSNMGGDSHKADCMAVISGIESSIGYPDYPYEWETASLRSRRTTMYGASGAMRIKSYGVEWRTPSNIWLGYGHKAWEHAFIAIERAVTNMAGGNKDLLSYYIPMNVMSYEQIIRYHAMRDKKAIIRYHAMRDKKAAA